MSKKKNIVEELDSLLTEGGFDDPLSVYVKVEYIDVRKKYEELSRELFDYFGKVKPIDRTEMYYRWGKKEFDINVSMDEKAIKNIIDKLTKIQVSLSVISDKIYKS